MKRLLIGAALVAVLGFLACGRSLFPAMAQPPRAPDPLIGPPPAAPVAPAPPSVSVPHWPDNIQPCANPSPDGATLTELVQQLKGVRRQREEVERLEAATVRAIREKMEEEKERIDEVEKYLMKQGQPPPCAPCQPVWGPPH